LRFDSDISVFTSLEFFLMSGRMACFLFATSMFLVSIPGCFGSGRSSGRPDIDAIPEEELRGAATKSDIYQFRAKDRKRGVAAVKQDLPDLLGGLSSYEQLKVTQAYKDTMKQIVEKMTALQGTLGGSPSKDAVVKAVDEIVAIAEKLPGKADPNPVAD